jgi:hypothetical protein
MNGDLVRQGPIPLVPGGFDREMVSADTEDGLHHVLTQTLTYRTRLGEDVTAPVGFWTDGASVPRILWRIYPPFGEYFRAAVVHDFMYYRGSFVRSKCDAIFKEAILACGCNNVTAFNLHLGVRLGGWYAYGQYRKKENSKCKRLV